MEAPLTSVQLVRLLAQEDRRKVVAALILHDGVSALADIAEATSLELRTVVDAVDRLVTGGMVEQAGDRFVLRSDVFQYAARTEVAEKPPSVHADQPADIARVLDVAFTDGKLVQWPSKHSKRLVVLDHLAQNFQIGTRYSEAEVNDILRVFNDDVAMSRRFLVDAEFLDRSGGYYWRCGGSV